MAGVYDDATSPNSAGLPPVNTGDVTMMPDSLLFIVMENLRNVNKIPSPTRNDLCCGSANYFSIALFFFLRSPEVPEYVTAPVRIGDIENAVLATGRIDAIERVNVGAQVSGQVKSLKVKLGDRVTKGQLIAEIDDVPQRNDLRNAEAALNVVKADLQAKQAQLKQASLRF